MNFIMLLFILFIIYFSMCGEVKITHTYKNGKEEDVPAGCLVSWIFIIVLSLISTTIVGSIFIGLYELFKFIF